jgi:4-cresol dehydrogenase (hydroxylating) flavoprotein subunit
MRQELINEFSDLPGLENINIITDASELKRYHANTMSASRQIAAVIIITNATQISKVLKIANKYKISVYPISTGNNWGYGSANPVINDSIILDLSNLNQILAFDEELGYVTLEPGVTQKILHNYFQEKGVSYLVPTTGAGPNCSILGNAIERGYGITPFSNHFESLISLEAVLPDGSIYRSPLSDFEATEVAEIFKYGIGPYLDGIFTQSNFGIVTKITIALAKKSEHTEIFMFSVKEAKELSKTIRIIRELKRELGSIVGGINLMNRERIIAMFGEQYEKEIALWTCVGGLYGPSGIIKQAKRIIKRKLSLLSMSVIFLNRKKIKKLTRLKNSLPNYINKYFFGIPDTISTMDNFFNILNGVPSEMTLPLAYLKTEKLPDLNGDVNPAIDDCGLIWFSPLLPIRPNTVEVFIKKVTSICKKYNIDPLITLTTISDLCFDSTIPILYNKNKINDKKIARSCYNELFKMSRDIGLMPYRINIDTMKIYNDEQHLTSVKLISKIKNAIDPNHILAPGRYSPYHSKKQLK